MCRQIESHTTATRNMAVSTASSKSTSALPLRSAGLSLRGALGAAVCTRSLAANGARCASGLALESAGLEGTEAQATEAVEKSGIVLGTRGAGATRVNGLRHIITKARGRPLGHVVDSRRGQVARGSLRRAGSEGTEIGKALRSSQVVGNAVTVRASGKLQSRALSSHHVVVGAAGSSRITISSKVKRCRSTESALVHVQAVGRLVVHVGSGRRLLSLEDCELSRISLTDRLVLQAHVVRKDVDGSTVLRGDARREDENFTRVVPSEHDQLGIKLERLRVIQVDVT